MPENFQRNSALIRFYKPTKSGTGAASKFEYRFINDDPILFLTMAKQSGVNDKGNAIFDWQNASINVKLSDMEAGDILAVIRGRKDSVGTGKGLYHAIEGGSKVINFGVGQNNSMSLSISSKMPSDKEPLRIHHAISEGEATALEVFLDQYLRVFYSIP